MKQRVIKYLVAAFAVLGAALAGYELYNQQNEETSDEVGEAAPAFSLPVAGEDRQVGLEDFEGRVVVLDFWATWCPPCHEQMPAVQKLADDDALSESVKVLSVNTDEQSEDPEQDVVEYLEENDYTFTTVIDDGQMATEYGVQQLPTLIVVDPDGRITHRKTGVHSEEELRRLVEKAGA